MTVSMVRRCHDTETKPISLDEIWEATREGKHGLKNKITQIRNRYEAEKDITGDIKKAKEAVAALKMELPGFLPSGRFSERNNAALVEHSGILCADLDSLGDRLPQIKGMLASQPFVRAIALSPSGDGLKVFFNVINDPLRHEDSFRSIRDNLRDMGVEVDEKCKDPARICFFTYDPELWLRTEGNEILPPADPLPRARTISSIPPANLTGREQISFGLFGELRHDSGKGGYFVRCPGESFHSAKTADKHTILYLESVPTLVCQHQSCKHMVEAFNRVLRSEIGKAERDLSHISSPYRDTRNATILDKNNGEKALTPEIQKVQLLRINAFESYVPPEGIELIGDYHVVKDQGFVFCIGGPPGVGKSLTGISLAVAGAKGEGEWFGMKVHRKFKTAILQTENGMFRLSRNLKDLGIDLKDLYEYVAITKPPPYGMMFRDLDFRKQIIEQLQEFGPDIVLIDPWNSVARDQEQKTYLDSFELIRSALPVDTVLGIIAHTRKPTKDERSIGRSLMNILAGSHVLVSVPRSVFVLQYASDDVEDDRVVWTCCKNNDGELGKRSAWVRKVGLFEPVSDFDWATFDSTDKRIVITDEMVQEVFKDGPVLLSDARDKLFELSGASKSQCYRVLSKKGKHADHLLFKGNFVDWLK